ncbi:hypothetical protein B0H13DRAFT_1885369 [Mycena leptocephala]|nr:hypothetical protein B0H13DRAFT_1885369 [Mycena leptocephala]
MALLHAVGFDGDNGPVEWGFGPMQMALAQTDFLLRKAAECFSIQRSVDKSGELEYADYDVHHTMEVFFESRCPPSSFSWIPIADAVLPRFELLEESEQWMEAERVTERDGKVLRVCKDSVGIVVADMVSAPSPGDSISDVSKGIRRYSSVGEGSVNALCSDDQLRSLKVEEWHPVIFGFEETPYEMAEIFQIILEYCSAATTLVPPAHIVCNGADYTTPSEAEFWRDNSDINYVDSAMICQAMEQIVAVLAEIIVYGGGKTRRQTRFNMTPPLPIENVHPSDFLRIMGGPAGRAIASDVDRACNVLLMIEIEDSEYALGEGWTPSLPIPAILSRIVRPSIYIVQQAVNPSFSALEGHFHLPKNTLRRLRSALRKILEVIHLISLQNPDYLSHVEIWNTSSSVHLLLPDPPVSDQCRGGFQILNRLIRQYSFRGQATSNGWDLEAGLQHLMHVSGCWSVLLGTRGEYPEYERSRRMMCRPTLIRCNEFVSNRLMDAALASFLPTRVSLSSVESWHPDDSLYGSLVANICPSVFYIQMFVNPSFDAALPFAALAFEECTSATFLRFCRSATMFLMLSLFMKEYGFEGDEDKSSPADRYVRAADIFRQMSSLAARGAGVMIEPVISSDRSRSQYEVFFVDFDTQAELVQYLCRPEVVNYCHNVLGPLRDVVSLICDRFCVRLPLPKDAPWLRHHLANFLRHLGTVAHAIGPDESVGRRKHIPTPSYTCLTYMACLIKKFGYDGDNIEHLEEHYQESLRIVRTHANDMAMAMSARLAEVARESAISTPELLVIPDIHATPPSSSITHRSFVQGEGSDTDLSLSGRMSAPLEAQGPCTVSQLCEVPTALRLLLPPFLLHLPDLNFYSGEPDGLLRYFVEVVGPYSRLINKGFPSCAACSADVPNSTKGLAHVIATQIATLTGQGVPIPLETIRTLPSYDLGNRNQDTLFRLLGDMLDSARSLRKDSEDPLDIPYSRDLEHVPCVPSWSAEEILLLCAQETVDPWVGEKYWVRECVQDASRLGKDLARMLAQVEGVDWYPDLPVYAR